MTVYADSILGCKEEKNILYLDESFKSKFHAIVNSWNKDKIQSFLLRFVEYFTLLADLQGNIKKYYHIYRIRAMLNHYDKTGSFSLVYEEPYKTKAIIHKEDSMALSNAGDELISLLAYIKKYAEAMEVLK